MPRMPFHPAPGIAALMPGTWTLPQNPIRGGIRYQPSLGEMMPAYFVVPQNPLLERYMHGLSGCRGMGRCGPCGCRGCDVGLGVAEGGPLPGVSSLEQWWEAVKQGSLPAIAVGGAVLIGGLWLLGGVLGRRGKR